MLAFNSYSALSTRLTHAPRSSLPRFPTAVTPLRMSPSASQQPQQDDQPNFPYTHVWASADGETHIAEGRFHGFEKKSYSGSEQFMLDAADPPVKQQFTQLDPGFDNPWHLCPHVQFVITVSGEWYIKTSDGSKRVFKAGDVLFQDNTKECPTAKEAKHYSGTVGEAPCQQIILHVDRKPEVDHPLPL